MRLNKIFTLVLVAIIGCITALAQRDNMTPPQTIRPSAYYLTDEVRNAIGLDSKEFSKVHSAYEKYIKTVFGEENANQGQPFGRGGHPSGMGGPGGPGGGRPPQGGGGMGRPGGNFGDHPRPSARPDDKPKTVDMEKFEKTKTKAEEKLCKTMKKIFKKDPAKYDSWTEIRQRQLESVFPPQSTHGEPRGETRQ